MSLHLDTWASEDPNVVDENGDRLTKRILEVFFAKGDLYLYSEFLFEIKKVKVPNAIAVIAGLIANIKSDEETPEETETPETPEETETPEEPEEITAPEAFIDIVFRNHGLGVTITKGFLVGVFQTLLGVDLETYLETFEIEAYALIGTHPLSVGLGVRLRPEPLEGAAGEEPIYPDFVQLEIKLNRLKIIPEMMLDLPDGDEGYQIVDELENIGAKITGAIRFKIEAPKDYTSSNPDEETGAVGSATEGTSFTHLIKSFKVL